MLQKKSKRVEIDDISKNFSILKLEKFKKKACLTLENPYDRIPKKVEVGRGIE
jgi:hypothetical protein